MPATVWGSYDKKRLATPGDTEATSSGLDSTPHELEEFGQVSSVCFS